MEGAVTKEVAALRVTELPWVLQTTNTGILFESILPVLNRCRVVLPVQTNPTQNNKHSHPFEGKPWAELDGMLKPWETTSLFSEGWRTSSDEVGVCPKCSKSLLQSVLPHHTANCQGPLAPRLLKRAAVGKRTRYDFEEDGQRDEDSDAAIQIVHPTKPSTTTPTPSTASSAANSATRRVAHQTPQHRSTTPTNTTPSTPRHTTRTPPPVPTPPPTAPAPPPCPQTPPTSENDDSPHNKPKKPAKVPTPPIKPKPSLRPRSLASRRVTKYRTHDGGLQAVLCNLPTDDKGLFAAPMPISVILSSGMLKPADAGLSIPDTSGSHHGGLGASPSTNMSPGAFGHMQRDPKAYLYDCGFPLMITPENMHILRGDQSYANTSGTSATHTATTTQDAKKPAATKKKQTKSKAKTPANQQQQQQQQPPAPAPTKSGKKSTPAQSAAANAYYERDQQHRQSMDMSGLKTEQQDTSPVLTTLGVAHPFAQAPMDPQASARQYFMGRQRPVAGQRYLQGSPYHTAQLGRYDDVSAQSGSPMQQAQTAPLPPSQQSQPPRSPQQPNPSHTPPPSSSSSSAPSHHPHHTSQQQQQQQQQQQPTQQQGSQPPSPLHPALSLPPANGVNGVNGGAPPPPASAVAPPGAGGGLQAMQAMQAMQGMQGMGDGSQVPSHLHPAMQQRSLASRQSMYAYPPQMRQSFAGGVYGPRYVPLFPKQAQDMSALRAPGTGVGAYKGLSSLSSTAQSTMGGTMHGTSPPGPP